MIWCGSIVNGIAIFKQMFEICNYEISEQFYLKIFTLAATWTTINKKNTIDFNRF